MENDVLRLEALRLALGFSNVIGETEEQLLERAEEYYKFLQKGEGDNGPN